MNITKTGLVYDDLYLQHDTGSNHPERAQRFTAIIEALKAAKLLDKLLRIESVPAERSIVEFCHESSYIDRFKSGKNKS